jgi:type II secretory pathway pseudopilin PulG
MTNHKQGRVFVNLHHSLIHSSFGIRHSAFAAAGAFSLLELLIVISIIIILAGLVLATVGYVQKKGARSRAETEIAALSAALESYRADNGIYPRDNPGNKYTDTLDARTNPTPAPSPSSYTNASFYLFQQLSGLDQNQQPVANMKNYFTFKPQMLGYADSNKTVIGYVRDPFGNSYGYSTANQGDSTKGYNPTFDLWSTAGTTTASAADVAQWIKNW